jgi:2-polyprenyl-3-methyl-5-hydroxy-6-metoxy-1,4-benzoquinol methylase
MKPHSVSTAELLEQLPPLDSRVPAWALHGLLVRRCPFCAANGESRWMRPDGLVVNRCPNCMACFVSPGPSEAVLDEFYETYFSTHSSLARPGRFWGSAIRSSSPFLDIRVAELASLVDFRGLRVLDIGCGRGEFLFRASQLGAACRGVELDSSAAEIARTRLGLTGVSSGDITAIGSDEAFGLIVMNDVIEHPLEPSKLIESALDLLNDDGLLAIWTPAAPHVDELNPVVLRVDLEHMQYLSEKTVAHIARRYDLDIVHLECLGEADLASLGKVQTLSGRARRLLISALRIATGRSRLAMYPFQLQHARLRNGSYNLFVVFRCNTQSRD